LHRNDGEVRTRRPRGASSDFLLKIGPRTNGSKHFLLGTEEIVAGALIPRHRHHGEDEILLINAGKAHVWLGDNEYDLESGGLVFIPGRTWVSLKNTGNQTVSLVFIFNDPSFEKMLLCASVPKGQPAKPLSREEVKECYKHGDAELDPVQSPPVPNH
jgi:mannose-6-phosphate isomerase-like protein (cupin superfamily)